MKRPPEAGLPPLYRVGPWTTPCSPILGTGSKILYSVPYGAGRVFVHSQAINCLAAIIWSLRNYYPDLAAWQASRRPHRQSSRVPKLLAPFGLLQGRFRFGVALFHGGFTAELYPAFIVDADTFYPDQVTDLNDVFHIFDPEIR